MKKTLIGLSCLLSLLPSCKISYEHLTGYPSANDRIISNDYKYLKTETFYFNYGTSGVIYGVSGESQDVLYLKDASYYKGLVKAITTDSVILDNKSYPVNFVNNISFGENPQKEALAVAFNKIKRNWVHFQYPTYSSLNEYIRNAYGSDYIYGNAVWDITVYGMKRTYTSVTYDLYVKQ